MRFYNKLLNEFCQRSYPKFFKYFPRAQMYEELRVFYQSVTDFRFLKEYNNLKYLLLDRNGYYSEYELRSFIVLMKNTQLATLHDLTFNYFKKDCVYQEMFYYLTGIRYQELENFDSIRFLDTVQVNYIRDCTRMVEICSNGFGYYCEIKNVKGKIYYLHRYRSVKVFDDSFSLLYSALNENEFILDDFLCTEEKEG